MLNCILELSSVNMSLAKVLKQRGYNCLIWDKNIALYDMFDQYRPDLFIFHTEQPYFGRLLSGVKTRAVKIGSEGPESELYEQVDLRPCADIIFDIVPKFNNDYKTDIIYIDTFMNKTHTQKVVQMLNGLTFPFGEYDIKVYTAYPNIVPPFACFAGCLNPQIIYDVVSSAKIVIDISESDIGNLPLQCFIQDTACLSYKPPIKEIRSFKDSIELKQMVDELLSNESDRLKYIQEVKAEILKNHTYSQFLDEWL